MKKLQNATRMVGSALGKEVERGNPKLNQFLQKYNYVIIDGKGKISGTNKQRKLGIGRIRLESKKILNGDFLQKSRK